MIYILFSDKNKCIIVRQSTDVKLHRCLEEVLTPLDDSVSLDFIKTKESKSVTISNAPDSNQYANGKAPCELW